MANHFLVSYPLVHVHVGVCVCMCACAQCAMQSCDMLRCVPNGSCPALHICTLLTFVLCVLVLQVISISIRGEAIMPA